jgi:DNA (cytosine-5)-methyltransferase 1
MISPSIPRNLNQQKPPLSRHAPTAIIGFSGGGGVECGILAAGVKPVLSIEFDPTKPELSKAIADCHQQNFNTPLLRMTVQEWARQGFPQTPDYVDFSHFSPVCSNFSQGNKPADSQEDISSAQAIADWIATNRSASITFENVPAYQKSYSWKIIYHALLNNGYFPWTKVLNFCHYGIPQSRRRFICVATKTLFFPGLYPSTKMVGWLEAIAHILPQLPELRLTSKQAIALESAKFNQPFLIPRVGYRGEPTLTPGHFPAPTIKRAIFQDEKGYSRSNVWNVWDGQKALNLTIEGFARLQTFPSWYKFPESTAIAGSIIGYSVPPSIIEQIYSVLINLSQKEAA